jgi:O-antigen ligase
MLEGQPFQRLLSRDPRTLALTLGAGLALVAILLGVSLALIGPIYTVALIVALAASLWVIAGLENALWSVIAVVSLLPFATLPFEIGFTPTFLDLAMGAVFFIYSMQWMTGERRRLASTPVHPFLILFIILTIFSFVAGLRYAGLTSTVLRRFAELILTMVYALILVDIVRTPQQLRRLIAVLIILGTGAALIGIGQWALPDSLAERFLVRLSVIGYPDGGVIQYVEQNPELAERAIGTSVNPNSLGGFLVMIAALAAPQLLTRYPVTGKRWHAALMLGGLVLCLILTLSRGSMLAFGAAILFIALLRYRKLLIVLSVFALLLLLTPWSQAYIERFVEGFQFADLATQMRLGEYQDALTLITRYPLLGVGFAGTPDIDIYLGVANVYLTIASNMGLLGLLAFLVTMAAIFVYSWGARPHLISAGNGLYAIWLGLTAGLIGALANGVFDHYFFNLEFQHAVTIFWTFVGLSLATIRIATEMAENPANPDLSGRGSSAD